MVKKSCTKYNGFPNCLKCELNTDFKCLECISNHTLIYESNKEPISCVNT